jgi:hypothetical protein
MKENSDLPSILQPQGTGTTQLRLPYRLIKKAKSLDSFSLIYFFITSYGNVQNA